MTPDGDTHTPAGGWLDDQERAAWLGVAALLYRLPAALESQLEQNAAITLFEYVVMARLSEQPCRRLHMSDLAVLANGSRSRLSHTVRRLEGKVYLTLDVDGLDPSIIPSTGTPMPGGLSWWQTLDVVRVLTTESRCRLIGADVMEFVPSAVPPGCDPVAARLTAKVLAWWWQGQQ